MDPISAPHQSRGIGMTSMRTRTRMIERLRTKGINDEAVLSALASVPRHAFVDEALASRAYEDTALPLGLGQTISQPYIVGQMIQQLREGNRPLGKTLEIGAGCGYQAAVLAYLAQSIYTIERIEELYARAKANLESIGERRVTLMHGDGQLGLNAEAPFDSIIVAAAAINVPPLLVDQLSVGGRLVIPVGTAVQNLIVIDKTSEGIEQTTIEGVKFVPLISGVE